MSWIKEKMDKRDAAQYYLKYADLFSKIEKNIEEYDSDTKRITDIDIEEKELREQDSIIALKLRKISEERRELKNKWARAKEIGGVFVKPEDGGFYSEAFSQFVEDLRKRKNEK